MATGPDSHGEQPGNQDRSGLSGKRKRQLESQSGARPKGAAVATGMPEDGDPEAIWDAMDREEARKASQA